MRPQDTEMAGRKSEEIFTSPRNQIVKAILEMTYAELTAFATDLGATSLRGPDNDIIEDRIEMEDLRHALHAWAENS